MREGLPIGAGWLPVEETAEVVFPYDRSTVGRAPVGTVELAGRALDEALAVAGEMARTPSHARRAALMGAHDALLARREEFERLLVLETGKPLVDCRVEVARTLVTLATAAEEVARLHGETVPLDLLPAGRGWSGSGPGGRSGWSSGSPASTTRCCWPPTRSRPRWRPAAR
ncbi:aldehyde dehydrogenase family protein [Nonomuraea recticatena]|uniref:aldehyde dehydrogenase family protein n=1 Tax=Nonomuraea recticatena TaxID=46178 RepID=UPI003606B21B